MVVGRAHRSQSYRRRINRMETSPADLFRIQQTVFRGGRMPVAVNVGLAARLWDRSTYS